MKKTFAALATAAMLTMTASAAFAMGDHKDKSTSMDDKSRSDVSDTAPIEDRPVIGAEEDTRMDEVAGIRIVPSIIAHDISLTPSNWVMRGKGQFATATTRVYTNKDGAITGLTLKSLGLPNVSTINERFNAYVVWLVDTDQNKVMNIGTLESRNMGEAVFGYSPEQPLIGYDRIVITPERSFVAGWPQGWQQLEADLPQTAMAPLTTPSQRDLNQPMVDPLPVPNDVPPIQAPDERAPMDEQRMENP